MRCWRCGGAMVDYGNELGVHCIMCGRTPDQAHEEKVEKEKAKVEGNPKTYGTDGAYRRATLAKICRGSYGKRGYKEVKKCGQKLKW